MRFMRLVPAGILLLGLLIVPASAAAAGPNHERISGTDVDNDFCGTGETVVVSFKGEFNAFEDQAFGHIVNTWTNPETGVSVIDSFSGGGKFIDVVDDGNGAYTVVTAREGIPAQLRLLDGPLLLQDVGLAIFYDHFDADDNYLGTDIVIRGPHPDLEAGFSLWCEVMIEALGL